MVSVIIPVYNGEQYLGEALQSILSQPHRELEIIVVDDGSNDATAAQAQAVSDPRVRYLFQPHLGASAARNRGVQAAGGAFLAFLDADDLWTPGKLALQVRCLADHPDLDMVFGHYVPFSGPEEGSPRPGYSVCTMLIRRDSFLRVGEFSTEWQVGEFIDWYARAEEQDLHSVMLPDVVLRRRIHDASTSSRKRTARADYARVLRTVIARRQTPAQTGG